MRCILGNFIFFRHISMKTLSKFLMLFAGNFCLKEITVLRFLWVEIEVPIYSIAFLVMLHLICTKIGF